MLYKYKCKLDVNDLNRKYFGLDDQGLINLLAEHENTLDKFFYFYIVESVRPYVLWHHSDEYFEIAPGRHRVMGTALRDKNIWLNAFLISESKNLILPNISNFELGERIDSRKGEIKKIPYSYNYDERKIYDWATDIYEYNFSWDQEYIKTSSFIKKCYTLDLNNFSIVLNPSEKIQSATVSVNEYNGNVFLAIKKLFEIVCDENPLTEDKKNQIFKKIL